MCLLLCEREEEKIKKTRAMKVFAIVSILKQCRCRYCWCCCCWWWWKHMQLCNSTFFPVKSSSFSTLLAHYALAHVTISKPKYYSLCSICLKLIIMVGWWFVAVVGVVGSRLRPFLFVFVLHCILYIQILYSHQLLSADDTNELLMIRHIGCGAYSGLCRF